MRPTPIPCLTSPLTPSTCPALCMVHSTQSSSSLPLEHTRPTANQGNLFGLCLLVEHSSITYSMGELSEDPSSQLKFQGSIPGILFLPPLPLLFSSSDLPQTYLSSVESMLQKPQGFLLCLLLPLQCPNNTGT